MLPFFSGHIQNINILVTKHGLLAVAKHYGLLAVAKQYIYFTEACLPNCTIVE